ncbi:histidinol-phosphate aminotransferase [[Clostridium] sordellii]|uniref:Histidinol-phosphate aminotransferase n=1 Tax=Paraclostridium sordellii TaxID=1505 RepID=A0A9P1L134_PARSO|nr:aminotransferase class I/II-fold pyridoxal phosphate-dependent enzyme [Paeniclostridium sordellii]CEN31580.1 histidinol-phosphate aminotransferase [[Clostridium] sordellii] [Paeniclostridium sordellii]CEP46514.1 histidinol-phosphate aminotransferase [[Clostridium] sordellii] [Paeniclostridium sordellii]
MYYINPEIKNLYRTRYKESRKKFLRLDMNENPEGIPKEFLEEVLNEITPEYLAMYPETDTLIDLLAKLLKVSDSDICLTNGSDDAMRLSFEVFGEPGKNVISVSPSFEMYSVYAKMYGMNHSKVLYNEKFEVKVEDMLNLIDQDTSIVVMLNPNSPVGNNWNEEQIRMVIEKAKINGAIVIIDEAYYQFYPTSFINLLNEYDNVMIFRTFSKLFSIAGCRIGYIVSNENIINMIKNASPTYSINSVAIKFAEKILENPYITKNLIYTEKQGREYLISKLESKGYEFYNNGANYILIKSKKTPTEVFENLKNKNILIKTYSNPILEKWIRVTTGSISTMERFWREFEKIDFL